MVTRTSFRGGASHQLLFVETVEYPLLRFFVQCTEEDVDNLFSRAGQDTSVRIVTDRETGRRKGFGFCEFADEAGAENAVNTLNGTDFNGRSLRVNHASRN
ncbi:unnamed protein product [Heligmosomoides polygyrus]|uniref:RRM domain-containing protein n=1 Tax=Heligmosomoides polygyrus TaxID=6339 RepID=A0A183G1T1_HELPZ|nr:unnamed protein product [Heligmosomoides polygyrus]